MNILITGCCGYIGSSLALLLREKGHQVTGLDSFNDYYSPLIKRHNAATLSLAGIGTTELDLTIHPLEPVLAGVDAIVHLAAQPGISATTPWEDYHRNNIIATHRLVEAARRAGRVRFVNIATSSVYGLDATGSEDTAPAPASWYGVTKLAAEQEVMAACRAKALSACSMRLFSVYGERERPDKLFPRLIRGLVANEEFPLFQGSREHRRSFTYVGDICRGILCALEKWALAEGHIFNLGTDQCFTTGDAITAAEKITGCRARIKHLPPRPGDQTATHANIDKIKRVLGWQPDTSLHAGLERMVAWYRTEIHGRVDWR